MKIVPTGLMISLLATTAATAHEHEHEGPSSTYAPETTARAEFELDERTRQGGRLTPFFSKYRPSVSVGGGARVQCWFYTEADGGHRPGTTGEIGMSCPVTLVAGQSFEAFERNRPIGRGVVLPPLVEASS